MAGEIFQPQVAQLKSSVTPREGVVGTSAVDLFTDVARVATEAAFAFTGQQELTELKNKFERVVQARQQGGNSSALQIKARADLDEAKANSPWVAKQADRLFKDTFGGGTTTGVFKATPEEEARDKHLQRVEEVRLSLGLSTSEEAQKRITLDESAKSAKIQADAQKDVREYNGELVFSNTQAQLNNNSIKFMDAVNRANVQGGGTISGDATRSLNLAVDQQVLLLKSQLNSQTRDPQTGHLLIDKAGYDSNLSEIEDWASNTKAMIGDSAYLKVIGDLNKEQSAEINFVATAKYRILKELQVAGGPAAVQAYLVAAQRKDGPAKFLLIAANPIAKDMFKQQGSFNGASATGLDKLILPVPDVSIMSEPEAFATGTQLNDPANEKLMISVVEKVATEDASVSPYDSMIQKNTDASALTWSTRFKGWAAQNRDKGDRVLATTVNSLKRAFLSSYVADNSSLPTTLEIKSETGRRKFSRKPPRMNVVSGEGVTSNTGKIAFNMFSVFNLNPVFLKKFGTENGNPDMTAQEAVSFVLVGAPQEPVVKTQPVSDVLGGEEGRKAVVEANRVFNEALSNATTLEEEVSASKQFDKTMLSIISGTIPTEIKQPREASITEDQARIESLLERGLTVEQIRKGIESLVGDEEGTPFSPGAKAKLIATLEEVINEQVK